MRTSKEIVEKAFPGFGMLNVLSRRLIGFARMVYLQAFANLGFECLSVWEWTVRRFLRLCGNLGFSDEGLDMLTFDLATSIS